MGFSFTLSLWAAGCSGRTLLRCRQWGGRAGGLAALGLSHTQCTWTSSTTPALSPGCTGLPGHIWLAPAGCHYPSMPGAMPSLRLWAQVTIEVVMGDFQFPGQVLYHLQLRRGVRRKG